MIYSPTIEFGNWVFSVMAMAAILTFIGFALLGIHSWWTGQKGH